MSSQHNKTSVAAISIFASGGMAAAKFAVGIAIGSLALISEALHSSVDLVATIITWAVVRVSDKPADEEHHYGHGKLESLSALGVTALLYVLAGGVLVESYSRLREGTAPPTISAVPFVVLLIDIVVNFWRARALHRAARETQEPGARRRRAAFRLRRAGLVRRDRGPDPRRPRLLVGRCRRSRRGRRDDRAARPAAWRGSTVQTLLDRAPEGAHGEGHGRDPRVPGVIDVERLRVRMVGATTFHRHHRQRCRGPIRSTASRRSSARRKPPSTKAFGDADLTFTAVPVARDNETVRERIMVIAHNSGLAIHHVTVHDLGGKLIVSIDLEVDAEMQLDAAHDVANTLERNIQRRVRRGRRGRHPYRAAGTGTAVRRRCRAGTGAGHRRRADANMPPAARSTTSTMCASATPTPARSSTSTAAPTPSMSVIKVHEHVDAIERALRRAFPSVKRVISHAEPPRA